MDKNKHKQNDLFYRYSSRIKDIYIELFDYTFFHSPSTEENMDKRFIGRKQIVQKLRTIITDSETKSGAYLVTGFRGMGKTSLVNKVLHSLKGSPSKTAPFMQYFRIWIAIILLAFINLNWLCIGSLFVLFFCCLILIFSDNKVKNFDPILKRKLKDKNWKSIRNSILRIIQLDVKKSSEYVADRMLQEIIIITIICFVASLLAKVFIGANSIHLEVRMLSHTLLLLLFIFINLLLNSGELKHFYSQYKKSKYNLLLLIFVPTIVIFIFYQFYPISLIWFILGAIILFIFGAIIYWFRFGHQDKGAISIVLKKIRNEVNYGHYLNVRINLGQDNLKEIDVLRYIAKGIFEKYQNWHNDLLNLKKFLWNILYLAIIFLAVGLVFYYTPVYKKVNETRVTSGFTKYFPSQALFIAEDLGDTSKFILGLDTLRKKTTANLHYNDNYLGLINNKLQDSGIDTSRYLVKKIDKGFAKSLQKFTISLDYLIVVTFSEIKHLLFLEQGLPLSIVLQNRDDINDNLSVFSAQPDYFFIISILFVFLIKGSILPYSIFGIKTHNYVLKRLNRLTERIQADVVKEQAGKIPMPTDLNARLALFSWGSRKSYPIMEAKAIEAELISILNDIDRIPRISVRPRFILIFDELDKIEPHYNVTIANKEEENIEDINPYRPETSAKRQEIIAKILANLKHFLNTAKAKFIFIAGREMYDASLADISDRDAAIGSIFHEVVYVNSFFTDSSDNQAADITSMAEQYLCRFLFPNPNYQESTSLSGYNKYLKNRVFIPETISDNIKDENEEEVVYTNERPESILDEIKNKINELNKINPTDVDKKKKIQEATTNFENLQEIVEKAIDNNRHKREQRYKVIFTLYNFVSYLAFRSNGAPKKITHLLEKYIVKPTKEELQNPHSLTAATNTGNLYLNFGYFNQYRLGFTAYLFTPFLLRISQHIHEFGDKLLVSASFLMDHLYKFHRFGFSWRTLELTPEIVAINKAPELREFIEDLISFLSNTHIRPIFSGLYQFKFNKKVASEIQFVSKISESESAAFNFTLDESLQIKRHYKKKLRELMAAYRGNRFNNERHIHSISFTHMILGDLHFYDQEYDDAIIQYMDATQMLRRTAPDQISIYQFMLLIRNMLKMGLTFEKKKTLDSAFMAYGNLTYLILGVRNMKLKDYGLQHFVLHKKDKDQFLKRFEGDIDVWKNFTQSTKSQEKILDEHFEASGGENTHEILVIGRTKPKSTKEIKGNLNPFKTGTGLSYVQGNESAKFKSYESMESFYDFADGANIADIIEQFPLLDGREQLHFKMSIFEGLRLIYQPLIARLHLIEKGNLGGVSNVDVLRSQKEFEFIIRMLKREEKFFIEAEYYNKVGDLLYFKNGFLFGDKVPRSQTHKYSIPGANSTQYSAEVLKVFKTYYLESSKGLLDNLPKLFKVPSSAYNYYMHSLYLIKKRMLDYDLAPVKKDLDFIVGIQDEKGTIIPAKVIECDITIAIINLITQPRVQSKFPIDGKSFYLATANALTDLGDTILCFATNKGEIGKGFFKDLLKFIEKPGSHSKEKDKLVNYFRSYDPKKRQKITRIQQAIIYFGLGGLLYAKVGEFRLYLSQLIKILHLIRDYCSIHSSGKEFLKNFLPLIEKAIVSKSLKAAFRSYENTNRPEIDKIRQIIDEDRWFPNEEIKKHLFAHVYNNTTVSADLREIIILFSILKLKSGDHKFSLKNNIVSPYGVINKKYNRVLELNFKAKLNFKFFEIFITCFFDSSLEKILQKLEKEKLESNRDKLIDANKKKLDSKLSWPRIRNRFRKLPDKLKLIETLKDDFQESPIDDIIQYLITDSIFCLNELIKTSKIFGTNYAVANYTSLAYAHENLGDWCKYFLIYKTYLHHFKEDKEAYKSFEKNLEKLIGSTINVSHRYHYEMALKYYYDVYAMHNEGNAYNKLINNLYYLDDDYNDNLLHFSIALERYKINTKTIEKKIENLKVNKLKGTPLYTYENYFPFES